MARELDDAILMLRVNELELGLLLLKTTRQRRGRAHLGRGDAGTSRRLAGARDHRPVAPDVRAAGCLVAQYVRHHRAGLVLRRSAVRTGAGCRSQLHAGAAGRRRRFAEDRGGRIQLRPAAGGERSQPSGDSLRRRRPGYGRVAGGQGQAARSGRKLSNLA